tara:strand:+ start:199 stop:750 length:552 start_codon:yes stop_codon:yes gene_type:complete
MFIRKKQNKSDVISIQIIDKTSGKYTVHKTIGSSSSVATVEGLVIEAKDYLKTITGIQEFDFSNTNQLIHSILNNIKSHKLVGIDLVLGKIFDQIGFDEIQDELFKDLVLYRLVYPKSKLKTAEYLYRYQQKNYSEDDIYRYLDKLHKTQRELVQKISFTHTQEVLNEEITFLFNRISSYNHS